MKTTVLGILVKISLVGCQKGPERTVEDLRASIEPIAAPDGFQCTARPTTAYNPGHVYRIDPRGVELLVKDLTGIVEPNEYEVIFPRYEFDVNLDASIGGKIIGALGPHVSGGAKAQGASNSTSHIEFREAKILRLDDEEEDVLIKRIPLEVKTVRDGRYFVVRDTISASEFDIEISDDDLLEISGDGALAKMFSAEGKIKYDTQERGILKAKSSRAFNVCMMVVEVELNRLGAAGDSFVIRPAEEADIEAARRILSSNLN